MQLIVLQSTFRLLSSFATVLLEYRLKVCFIDWYL